MNEASHLVSTYLGLLFLAAEVVYTAKVTAGHLSESDKQMFAIVITAAGAAQSKQEQEKEKDDKQGGRIIKPSLPLPNGSPHVPLEKILDGCFTPCLASFSAPLWRSKPILCDQFNALLGTFATTSGNCANGCGTEAMVDAKELCVEQGCDPSSCGVFGEEELQSQRFRVRARLILRGKDKMKCTGCYVGRL